MTKNKSIVDHEIDLSKLIKIVWKGKIKIILIVLIFYGIGAYYVASNTKSPSYNISLELKEANRAEFTKFIRVNKSIDKVSDIVKIYNSNSENDGNVNSVQNFDLFNSESLMESFILEFMDYNEVIEVLNNSSIKEELSQLSKENQQKELYKYAKLFSLNQNFDEKRNKFKNTYTVNFTWHDESEIVQILNDVIKITLLNLEKSIYEELETITKTIKETRISDDLKRIDYLLEQSSIAKTVDIKDNQIKSIDIPNSNVMFNISTINANMPYYLRGYSAIDKEIELIKKRGYKELDVLSSEINKFKKENTNWINYNIYLAELK
jgi:LPS O-antigen subunit length determinant protein (WzzB/FepE family)